MNFLINILHDPPNYHVESIIGNLIYFKQVTVRVADGRCLKFCENVWRQEEFTEGGVCV
jgi:hypothetical protein